MRAMVFHAAHGPLVADDRPIPEPGPGEVRIAVQACGVCHSDHSVGQGLWPGLEMPRVPGHEITGVVDALGSGVSTFAKGERVGLGGHDGTCPAC